MLIEDNILRKNETAIVQLPLTISSNYYLQYTLVTEGSFTTRLYVKNIFLNIEKV